VFLFENEMLKEEIHIDSMELKYIEEEWSVLSSSFSFLLFLLSEETNSNELLASSLFEMIAFFLSSLFFL
jgi:hypothetical protein